MNGLLVTLYVPRGDPTSRPKHVFVFDKTLRSGNFSLDEVRGRPDTLCLRVVRRPIGRGEYLHLEPFEAPDGGPYVGPMFGGAYVFSSDSRFRDLAEYPLPLHDRYETPDDYALMSR